MGLEVKLRGNNLEPSMSALGQKRTSAHVRVMSALPPKSGYWDSAAICPLCSNIGSYLAVLRLITNSNLVGQPERPNHDRRAGGSHQAVPVPADVRNSQRQPVLLQA